MKGIGNTHDSQLRSKVPAANRTFQQEHIADMHEVGLST